MRAWSNSWKVAEQQKTIREHGMGVTNLPVRTFALR